MSKLIRSLLWSGLVVAGVAACGDDVIIAPPPPPPAPGVNSVSVGPTGITIAIDQTLQMAAAVNADAGVATTVTWATSSAATASVSPTGLVKGVAAGSVAITACSTVNPSACGQATVIVGAVTPASISIQAITAGGTIFPVVLAAVAGQIDVVLNVDGGSQKITSVDALIDGVVASSQGFSGSQWQEMVAEALAAAAPASDGATANAAVPIVLSINTAAFNGITGATTYKNGPRLLTARANLATGSPVSTPSTSLTFVNANAYIQSNTFTGTTASAVGTSGTAIGLGYRRGGLTIGILPVIYNVGQALAVGSAVTFGSGCDASGNGVRNLALTAPATGSSTWTAALPQTIPTGGSILNTVSAYEFLSTAGCPGAFPTGETAGLVAVDNAANTIFFPGAPANAATVGIRLDNRAPGAPTFRANPNGRGNGWINAAVTLANNTTTTSNGWLANGAADAGIGGGSTGAAAYLRFVRTAAATGGLVDDARAATPASTLAGLVPTATGATLCALASAQDELGNESARPAAGSVCLSPPVGPGVSSTGSTSLRGGYDINPPTIAYDLGALATNARLFGATIGNGFTVTVADLGLIGNSGMLAGSPAIGTVIRRNAGGTTFGPDCVVGSISGVTGLCVESITGETFGLPLVFTGPAFPALAGAANAGYYSHTATANDAAGNSTPLVGPNVIVYDVTPAVATTPSVPAVITGAFGAAAFLNDDLSIRDYYWTASFVGGLTAPTTIRLAAAPTVVDAFNAATLSNVNFGISTPINTYIRLQAAAPAAYAPAANNMSFVNLFVRDQAQPAYSAPGSTPVAPTGPATGVPLANVGGPVWAFTSYTSPLPTNLVVCAGTLVAPLDCVTTAIPTTTVFAAVANGTVSTFPNPFSRVDFYGSNGTDLILLSSVPAANATGFDDGFVRNFTYTTTLTQAQAVILLAGSAVPVVRTIYAVGANATGTVGMVVPIGGATITINP